MFFWGGKNKQKTVIQQVYKKSPNFTTIHNNNDNHYKIIIYISHISR